MQIQDVPASSFQCRVTTGAFLLRLLARPFGTACFVVQSPHYLVLTTDINSLLGPIARHVQ